MEITDKEVSSFLTSLLNYTGEKKAGALFTKALLNEHRTLQATFWRIMQDQVIPAYAESAYDPRNEGAVMYAKKLADAGTTYIPRI